MVPPKPNHASQPSWVRFVISCRHPRREEETDGPAKAKSHQPTVLGSFRNFVVRGRRRHPQRWFGAVLARRHGCRRLKSGTLGRYSNQLPYLFTSQESD